MRTSTVLTLLVLLVSPAAWAEETPTANKKLAPFALQDFRGTDYSLEQFKQHKRLVVDLGGNECTLVKLYAPRLARLAEKYAARGVGFVAIDANSQDSLTALAAFARQHGINYPLLTDVGNKVAD